MGIRNLILSTGLMGLLGAQEASAKEEKDTRYLDLSEAEVQAEVLKRAQRFRYEDFKRLEGNENFDGIVLASSTCPRRIDGLERRNEIILLRLMDDYEGAKSFNGDPLVFGYFDICGVSRATELGIKGLSFIMYLDGEELTKKYGAPLDDGSIPASYEVRDFLLRKNLIESNGKTFYLVNNEGNIFKSSKP